MGHIQASGDSLLEQASWTAAQYMRNAMREIDKEFGKNFAKDNPDLVASFMKVAASDMNYATLAKAQSEAIEVLAGSVNNLSDKIECLGPA